MAGLRKAFYVDQLERRVRRRLQIQQIAPFGDLLFDGAMVRGIEEPHLHARPGRNSRKILFVPP
jgi:hypothetical protein